MSAYVIIQLDMVSLSEEKLVIHSFSRNIKLN
jgi:hypothetical protein